MGEPGWVPRIYKNLIYEQLRTCINIYIEYILGIHVYIYIHVYIAVAVTVSVAIAILIARALAIAIVAALQEAWHGIPH